MKCDQNGCCQNCEIAGVTCEQIDRTTRESIPRADRLRRALALEQLHITVREQKNIIAAQNNQIESLQSELRAATRKLRQFDVSELHLQPSGFLSSFSAHPPVTVRTPLRIGIRSLYFIVLLLYFYFYFFDLAKLSINQNSHTIVHLSDIRCRHILFLLSRPKMESRACFLTVRNIPDIHNTQS